MPVKTIAMIDNLPDGGAKRVLYQQIKGLAERDYRIDWYTNDQESQFEIAPFCGEVFRFNLNISDYRGLMRPFKELSLFTLLLAEYLKMASLINRRSYDAIIVHPDKVTQAPILIPFVKAKKIYFMEEVMRSYYEPELHPLPTVRLKRLYEKFRRRLVKHIDYVNTLKANRLVTTSAYNAQKIWEIFKRQPLVLTLGVDVNAFKPIKKPQRDYFLFIGSASDIDGYPILKALMQSFNGSIKFKKLILGKTGFSLDDKAVIELYQHAAATLCLAKAEPFGLAAIESMACGTPVIAVDEGGYKETVIDQVTGLVIKREVKQIENAILQISSQRQKLENLGKQGRQRVREKYNWDKHLDKLEKLIEEI